MDISEVKQNLNRKVCYSNKRMNLDRVEYILTGCILRKNENGYYYTAELKSVTQPVSIMHVELDDIMPLK